MISRRTFLAAAPLSVVSLSIAACRKRAPFSGYAYIANEEGNAIAVVDLEVFAVAKHIPIPGSPTQVVAAVNRPAVYVLAANSGVIHEIHADQLRVARSMTPASQAVAMHLTNDEASLYLLASEPRALIAIDAAGFQPKWKLPLPAAPIDFAVSDDGQTAAVTTLAGIHLVDLTRRSITPPLGNGHIELGAPRFLGDNKLLLVADLGQRLISAYDVASGRLVTHLPVAVRPEHLCFNRDGGQLFVTGEGMDAVVVIYPYRTPEVAETLLIGHAPAAMAASSSFLLVASPSSGDVSILNIATRRVIAVVQVGSDPGFIAITPDDQYALVLNRASGDVSVIRLGTITPNRYKSAGLFTVIPVGSRPVSAAVRAI